MLKFDTFMTEWQEEEDEIPQAANLDYRFNNMGSIDAIDKESQEESMYDTNGIKKRNLINLQNLGDYSSSGNNS